MSFLLDTNVVSESRRAIPEQRVVAWLARTPAAEIFISVLTLGEIAKGAAIRTRRNAAHAALLEQWLATTRAAYENRIIGIDVEIAESWGRLDSRRTLPIIDGLLAATAVVRGMTVVTRNVRDFSNAGVPVLNPWDA